MSVEEGKKTIQMVFVNGEKVHTDRIDPEELINNPEWEPCIVPERLGVPLKVKRYRHRLPDERIHRDVGLFMMVRPEDGLADMKWQQECGLLGFARSDGKDFTASLFWQLFDYIYTLMDYYGDTNGASLAIRRMHPKNFADYSAQIAFSAIEFKK